MSLGFLQLCFSFFSDAVETIHIFDVGENQTLQGLFSHVLARC